jgi:hypothetical protein
MYLFCLETKKVPKKIQGCTAILRLRCAKKLKKRLFSKTRLPVARGHAAHPIVLAQTVAKKPFFACGQFFYLLRRNCCEASPGFRWRPYFRTLIVTLQSLTPAIALRAIKPQIGLRKIHAVLGEQAGQRQKSPETNLV